MNKNYRKNFLRENIMYGVYGRILLEHFSDSYDYLEKFKKLNKKRTALFGRNAVLRKKL